MRNLRLQFIMSVSIISLLLIAGCKKSEINADKNLDASGVAMASVGAGNQKASGGGTTEELGEKTTFTFNAVKKSDGSVTGKLIYNVRGQDVAIHVDITCLRIVGNNIAHMSGVVTKLIGTPAYYMEVGRTVVFSVTDNGEGSADNPDLFSDLIFFYPTGTANCQIQSVYRYLPMSGNIQVQP
jgi:hypothetical protein